MNIDAPIDRTATAKMKDGLLEVVVPSPRSPSPKNTPSTSPLILEEPHERNKTEEKGIPRVKPATDIVETAEGFFIYMDMPGVSKEALIIDLNEDEIKVTGGPPTRLRTARSSSTWNLATAQILPGISPVAHCGQGQHQGLLKNGVLELHLPKAAKAQARKIDVRMG